MLQQEVLLKTPETVSIFLASLCGVLHGSQEETADVNSTVLHVDVPHMKPERSKNTIPKPSHSNLDFRFSIFAFLNTVSDV